MKIIDKHRNGLLAVLIFLLLFLVAGGYALSQYTLLPLDVPLVCAVAAALLAGVFLCKLRIWVWLTGSKEFLPNYLLCSVCACILGLSLFYVCNYAFADEEGGMRNVVVESKCRKERHKSRRIGRNRYVQGEAYNVYYMKVRFDGGLVKEVEIDRSRFARLRDGDTLSLFVAPGLFGIPVLKYDRVSEYARGSRYRDQFSR